MTAVVARAPAGLGRQFSEPEVVASRTVSPQDAVVQVLDVTLNGLAGGSVHTDGSRAEAGRESHARL